MSSSKVIPCAILLLPFAARAQTAETRVDAGHLQYETDAFSCTHSNVGGVSTRLYTALDPVLKVGLEERRRTLLLEVKDRVRQFLHLRLGIHELS